MWIRRQIIQMGRFYARNVKKKALEESPVTVPPSDPPVTVPVPSKAPKTKEDSQLSAANKGDLQPKKERPLTTYPANTPVSIKYDDFMNEYVSGQSLMDSQTLAKHMEKKLAKKFGSQDIEEIQKHRQEMLEKRAEVGFLQKHFDMSKAEVQKLNQDMEEQIDRVDDTAAQSYELDWKAGKVDKGVTPFRSLNNKYALDLSKDLNLPPEFAQKIVKQEFFWKKNQEEAEARFKVNQERRKKKKQIKELVKYINQEAVEKEGVDELTSDKTDTIGDAMKQEEKMQAVLGADGKVKDSAKEQPGPFLNPKTGQPWLEPFEIHKKRTLLNYKRFFEKFFCEEQAKLGQWIKDYDIRIDEVIIKNNIYTVSVFWVFENDKDQPPNVTNYVNDQLNRYSGVICGQMCRDLELRRGPKIRFYPSQTGPRLREMREDLAKEVPELLREEQLKKLNLTEEKVQKIPEVKQTLDRRVDLQRREVQDRLETAISNKTWLKEAGKAHEAVQTKIKAQPKERVRDNRNPDGSRKKYQKKHRADSLWQDIMAG